MSTLLIKNGKIVTLGAENQILEGHGILIENDTVTKIASEEKLQKIEGYKNATVVDANGGIILPGFINAHMHFYSTFAKGLNKAKPAKDFQQILENLWWRLDKKLTLEDCYYSALLACIDAIKQGTTTIIDHHASPCAVTGSLDKTADAVLDSGLRACLCYELSDRDGNDIAKKGIEENLNFIQKCDNSESSQLKALFGMHASFTIEDSTMKRAVDKAKEFNTGFHIHAAEAKSDQDKTFEKHGLRVVERLHKHGVLGPKSICAHCIHINENEMALLAESGTAVVHNPQSNMNNAVGVADIVKMTEKGILVGLGTDAMTVNMLEELRSAVWIHKLDMKDPGAGFMESVNALVRNNATIAQAYWDEDIGEICEGGPADVIIMDYDPPTEFSENTFAGHLVFGLPQASVTTTIAGGKILMKNRLLVDVDEKAINARARELSKALWSRF